MGMQCHFDYKEIEDAGFRVERESAASIIVMGRLTDEPLYYFNVSDNQMDTSAWFDIGQLRPMAVEKLHWLIRNRACFTCS